MKGKMSHTIETFKQVKLILADNPEDDRYWRTCWDLSDNGYAMDELLKSGNLKSGETVPLSDGLLRSMLVKAQKDARGFQNTLLGECAHGSEAERKRQAYRFAEILNQVLCEGSPAYCSAAKPNLDLSFPDFED